MAWNEICNLFLQSSDKISCFFPCQFTVFFSKNIWWILHFSSLFHDSLENICKFHDLFLYIFKFPWLFLSLGSLSYLNIAKSWMTASIFEEWLLCLHKQVRNKCKKIVLVIDNCNAHPQISDFMPVTMEYFQPNNISILHHQMQL